MKPLLIILVGLLLTACSQPAPLTLQVFECGEITVHDISLFSPGVDVDETKSLVDSCYLIQHPKGHMIWDTGITDAVGEKGVDVFGGKLTLKVMNPLADQLTAINLNPTDIQFMGISHFHGDHTGNANLFTNASLFIQQEEYDAAFGDTPENFGFNASSYDKIDKTKIQILNGDHDVFGDGSVIIKPAPGHTPGHQMLLVNLENEGPILLSGDLYHFTKNRTHKRVPSFNFDKKQTLETMDSIEMFIQKTG
ncbi:MAG: glyoxylase-like metal-dependent hydrolase (beta-lactamase superfamily II), partial [Bermanella sp.]